ISSFAEAVDNCIARHSSTCCFKGPKFRCIRSTPMARLSSSEKCLECFASTGVYAPETMFPNCRGCIPGYVLSDRAGSEFTGLHAKDQCSLLVRRHQCNNGGEIA